MTPTIVNSIHTFRLTIGPRQVLNVHPAKTRKAFFVIAGSALLATGIILVGQLGPNEPRRRNATDDAPAISEVNRTSSASNSDVLRLESKMESPVYKAIIKGIYLKDGIRLIVVRDHTVPGNPADGGLYEQLQRAEKELTLLSQDTVTDFLRNNSGHYPLTTSLKLNVEVKRISESESNAIFQDGKGWDEFYEKFPSSQGVMELSKPGFNTDLTQALVYVGNQGSWKGGAGYYVLLVKEDDAWKIKKRYTSWVS